MSEATCWLVITSPRGETNDPEPPLLKRSDARRTLSSQPSLSFKPRFFSSCARGTMLNGQQPSSAGRLSEFRARTAQRIKRVFTGGVLCPGIRSQGSGVSTSTSARAIIFQRPNSQESDDRRTSSQRHPPPRRMKQHDQHELRDV